MKFQGDMSKYKNTKMLKEIDNETHIKGQPTKKENIKNKIKSKEDKTVTNPLSKLLIKSLDNYFPNKINIQYKSINRQTIGSLTGNINKTIHKKKWKNS